MLGFPIRTSADRGLVDGSSQLFAVTHVLHRFLAPRHSPLALCSLERTHTGKPRVSLIRTHTRFLPCERYDIFARAMPVQDARACSAVLKERCRPARSRRTGALWQLRETPSKRKRRRWPTSYLLEGGTESLTTSSGHGDSPPVHQQVCLVPDGTNVHHRQRGTP